MAQPALARERLFALREAITRIETADGPKTGAGRGRGGVWTKAEAAGGAEHRERPQRLSFGHPALDARTDGGLPLGGLCEIRNGETRDIGAASGFVLALLALCQKHGGGEGALLWISEAEALREAALPDARGLENHGLSSRRFFLARPRRLPDALWMAEAALAVSAFCAVVLEMRGNAVCFGLRESRRLQLRAQAAGMPLILLRQSGEEEASSARFRLRVDPAPAAARPMPDGPALADSIGNPVFHVTAEKSRAPASSGLFLEWNPHDRRFSDPRAGHLPLRRNADTTDSVAVVSASSRRSGRPTALGAVLAFDRAS
ncbi:hypothetical protein LXM94_15315 [Rhizobium sp. TRM95111]|uniref:ImuA family protein n=1 Tax=Rhizobium alarense TaxID=2846851 RepID=UPI001F3422C8|nr:hypothetical protein [Rhizobium alarense]MCF3641343.1 hypothetical protein [Rhizobium alarense]